MFKIKNKKTGEVLKVYAFQWVEKEKGFYFLVYIIQDLEEEWIWVNANDYEPYPD
jgi:hypothetical protein